MAPPLALTDQKKLASAVQNPCKNAPGFKVGFSNK
jgi:hypothetical protein